MRRHLLFIAVLGLTLGQSPANAAPAREILFYLEENRLITLEFQFTVDGKSASEIWQDYLTAQFEKIDADKDGIISGEERGQLPNSRLLRILQQGNKQATAPDKMDGNAFRRYIEEYLELQPFQVSIQSPQNTNVRQVRVFGMQNNPNQAAEMLFAGLDTDSDSRLSREEMEAALHSFAKKDLDQDETISTAELVPVNYGQYFVSPGGAVGMPANQSPFLSMASGSSRREVALRLTNKYDAKEKDNALSREELGVSENIFGAHDIDGNGKWDFEEIQQYLRAPTADVIVKVRLGASVPEDKARIEFEHGEELKSEIKNAIGSLNLRSVQMEVSATGRAGRSNEEELKRQFRSIDRDNNGYIDKEEAQRLPNATLIFQDLDKDNDEKLFLEEMLAGILPLAELMQQQIRLTVTDRGRDLFRILDSDGDNRLSKREFRAMPNRAELWDKDGDGHVTLSEIQQQYHLVASQGGFNLLNRLNGVVLASPAGMPVPQRNATREGPLWFQRMDRNGDGDLSPREFLGSRQDFERLDQDRDGLIDPAEAMAAEK